MMEDEALLLRAAQRATVRPEFLGWVLDQYGRLEALSMEQVLQQLRVAAADGPRLCLRPRGETFLAEVTQIAEAFRIDRAALAAVVRRVEAVEALRVRELPGSAGSLLAARTRKPRPPDREGGGDD